MAWWYRAYAKEQIPEHRAQYQAAEMDAQRQRIGLWRDSGPVPPWEWRKAKREN
jgi:endonuclease YncB( thermonuclease family)